MVTPEQARRLGKPSWSNVSAPAPGSNMTAAMIDPQAKKAKTNHPQGALSIIIKYPPAVNRAPTRSIRSHFFLDGYGVTGPGNRARIVSMFVSEGIAIATAGFRS